MEVFTSKAAGAGPSRDWLGFVKSPRARNKIRAWFSKERRDEAIEQGKDAIARAMRKQNLPIQRILTGDSLVTLAHEMRYPDISALYAAIGEGHVAAQNVVQKLVQALGGEEGATEDIDETATRRPRPAAQRRQRQRHPASSSRASTTCGSSWPAAVRPVPGDPIIGFVTRGNGVSVHRADCVNVDSLSQQPERILEVEWAPTQSSVFLVAIQVEALDRSRLLSDVTRVLSDQHVNILSAAVQTSRDRVATSRFTFEMGDPQAPGPRPEGGPGRGGRLRRLQNHVLVRGHGVSPGRAHAPGRRGPPQAGARRLGVRREAAIGGSRGSSPRTSR